MDKEKLQCEPGKLPLKMSRGILARPGQTLPSNSKLRKLLLLKAKAKDDASKA
jgi:hypothetical protein